MCTNTTPRRKDTSCDFWKAVASAIWESAVKVIPNNSPSLYSVKHNSKDEKNLRCQSSLEWSPNKFLSKSDHAMLRKPLKNTKTSSQSLHTSVIMLKVIIVQLQKD